MVRTWQCIDSVLAWSKRYGKIHQKRYIWGMDDWREWMRLLAEAWPALVMTKQLYYADVSHDLLGSYCVQTSMQAVSKQRNSEQSIGLIFIAEALILQLYSFLLLIGSNILLYNRIYATIALMVIITSQYWHRNCDWKCTFKSLISNTSVLRKKTSDLVKQFFFLFTPF